LEAELTVNPIRAQIRSMLQVEPKPGGFRALLTVRHDLSLFPDHFPNNPILPGLCMLQAVLLAAAISRGLPDLRLQSLKNAKLMQPIAPGDEVTIEADTTDAADGRINIKATFLSGQTRPQTRRAEFSLVAHP
jgi:3-hydroxyacyl-[acyl-carrier-protein] dehydratase